MQRKYLCIDLKSFYASVECVERKLDPLTTNLVVADSSRTEKTICLAVTPSLKAYGIPGRARLFEVVQTVKKVNNGRKARAFNHTFTGKSYNSEELNKNPSLKLDYITATPRMAHYMEYSTRIYEIYLKYVSSEDILVYSIDEVFMDITNYLQSSKMTPRDFAMTIIRDVLSQTGITATAGIGTNMYLAKIAMDITAKKMKADKDGVRIAELDEMTYRRELWEHKPITDFWRVGQGYAKKLADSYMFTMGDIAKASTTHYGRLKLKRLFGINSKMLVDHAWGYEPCTLKEAKAYTPEAKSISSGQVLQCPYSFEKARVIVWEMAELMSLDLVEKGLVTKQLVLSIGYDVENVTSKYDGEVKADRYGRKIPKHAHGTANIENFTSSTRLISDAVLSLYDRTVDKDMTVRRVTVTACNLIPEKDAKNITRYEQMDLFTDYEALNNERQNREKELQRERKIQEAMIDIKHRFGKNAIIKGTNLQEGATSVERNGQIGGHKA